MGVKDVIDTLVQVPTLLKLKRGMQPRPLEEKDCIARMVEANATRFADRPAVLFENRSVTWREFNEIANRYARCIKELGVEHGDTVSVVMENRIEFLAVFVALNKIGAIAALINTNLRGRPLEHCMTVTGSKKCVFGEELAAAIAEVRPEVALNDRDDFLFVPDAGNGHAPVWSQNLATLASNQAGTDLPDSTVNTLGDTATYIFTSGTTGLPKAAVMSNRRFMASAALSHRAGLKATEQDRMYLCLPLYHATGLLIGAGAAFSSGASMFVRRRFSASRFLSEVREQNTNLLIYIGELCRYLCNTPEQSDDADNPLQRMIGNGMRPDVWLRFKHRFGVKRISEFYGSSEGNVAFANLLNKDCTIGMTAAAIALVKYDVDADEIVRNDDGRCIEVQPGEAGLLLGQINPDAVFEGYTDASATEKKVLRGAFENGDAWFNTGDLIREVDVGFTLGYPHYQFVDRVGDTYRWKSENVSTNEVGEIINTHDQVSYSNVYGVEIPGTDGRAGMAALTLNDGIEQLDLDTFSKHVTEQLPAYAIPVFVRVQKDIEVTGTFKMVKGKLKADGYDTSRFSDPVFVMKPGESRYVPLDRELLEKIQDGHVF